MGPSHSNWSQLSHSSTSLSWLWLAGARAAQACRLLALPTALAGRGGTTKQLRNQAGSPPLSGRRIPMCVELGGQDAVICGERPLAGRQQGAQGVWGAGATTDLAQDIHKLGVRLQEGGRCVWGGGGG